MSARKKILADAILLFITMIWGSSFVLMKNTISQLHPLAFLTLRFLLAWLIILLIFHKNLKNLKIKEMVYGSLIGFFLFLGMALQVVGLKYTYASKSAFITGLTVVLVPIFAAIVERRIPRANVMVGVIFAFTGLYLLNGAKLSQFNFGDFLTLLADFGFVFQIIFIDIFTSREDVNPVNIAIFQLMSGAVLYIIFSAAFGINPLNIKLTLDSVFTILITGVLGTALAFTAQVFVQKYTTPTHTALIFSAEPVFGAIFSAIIPSVATHTTEILPLISYAGCGLILIGMIIAELNPDKNLDTELS
ncbi:DMT family transporter [Caldicellulosiruptor morganii]|uniref:DMT family transporter n=1 Tax=Caldicellulosiruptor morganii TaxID=1387555 RepID=A0ABY7BPS0_9FIRM|nr:DMT family transporter [Caldicellulosiruptor morganii]WAM34505.1 DMT family transporter [Caldicellulosiruptor morganii]